MSSEIPELGDCLVDFSQGERERPGIHSCAWTLTGPWRHATKKVNGQDGLRKGHREKICPSRGSPEPSEQEQRTETVMLGSGTAAEGRSRARKVNVEDETN